MHTLHTSTFFRTALFLLALAALSLAGCEKSSRGLGDSLASVYYLKGWTYVRAAPSPQGKAMAKAGPNTRVTISDTEDGWSKVSIDDGRVIGWVESAGISEAPVKEASRRASGAKAAPAKKPAAKPKASAPKAASTASTAASAEAPAPSEPAPEAAQTTETVQPEAASQDAQEEAPAPEEKPALIILSPSEAAAATAPPAAPAKKPAPGKQAKPEAFDPF